MLYATGSSARQTTLTENKPCDAVIMAVVDSGTSAATTSTRSES
jgi:microcompartment protein CcmK/EutM